MAGSVPPAPEFGETLPVEASPDTVAFLARRRSASAMTLTAPGPDKSQLEGLLRLAVRVPDHGKLAPWRFIVLQGEAKAVFAERIAVLAPSQANPTKATAVLRKLTNPPVCVAVISRHLPGEIPEWEQRQSAAAVCHQLLLAASAQGWGANWITDWYSYDPRALEILGVGPDEKVAGYLYIGTTTEQPQERQRPDATALTSYWTPN